MIFFNDVVKIEWGDALKDTHAEPAVNTFC